MTNNQEPIHGQVVHLALKYYHKVCVNSERKTRLFKFIFKH